MVEIQRPYTTAIILSAGSGTRFSLDKTKQRFKISGISVLERTVSVFEQSSFVDEIIIVHKASEADFVKKCIRNVKKSVKMVVGGETRAMSARLGFSAVSDKSGFVLIHDAARCLITTKDIASVASAAYENGAASAAGYVTDTVKRVTLGKITGTVSRDDLLYVATPQAFSCDIYNRALNLSLDDDKITDDNMRVEALGIGIVPVITSKENIKITTLDDVSLAEFILSRRNTKNDN